MQIKLKSKLFISITVVVILLSLGVFSIGRINRNALLSENKKDTTYFSEKFLNAFKSQDTKTLMSTLDVILQDPGFKNVYLNKEREDLNTYGQPLFQKLKKDYGITHFYFIRTDGTVYLRLHDPKLYDDKVERVTFKNAVASKEVGFGIELGKTAFALRVVKPYMDGNKLIGYVELGQEIDQYLDVMKKEIGNEYAMFVDKKNLDRANWASVRQNAGQPDNWDNFNSFIPVNKFSQDKKTNLCFNESNAKKIFASDTETVIFNNIDSNIICSGFVLRDVSDKIVGAILLTKDVTVEIQSINGFIFQNRLFVVFLLLIAAFISFYALKKTREAKEKYKYLFDYSQDAIMTLISPNWNFSDGNPAMLKMFGIKSIEELSKLTPVDLSPKVQPDGRLSLEKAKEAIGLAMEKGYHSFEWVHKRMDNSEFFAQVTLAKVNLDGGFLLQAVVRDMTEEKISAEKLKLSQEETKKSLAEAEKINKLMVGRELEMIKLKKEISKYKNKKYE